MANKYIIGTLIMVLLTASIYIVSLDNNVRIDVKNTYSEFKVYENDSWILGGEERTILYDGSTKMRAWKRVVNSTIDLENNQTIIYRYSYFKNDIVAVDTYLFYGNEDSVELFPISHEINIYGAKNAQEELNKSTEFILDYEVSKLGYYGETDYELGFSHEFDHNMKVEWEGGNYYERLYKYKDSNEGKLNIKYRVNSNNFTISARLFDPIIEKDTVFTELISNEADIFGGEAIYQINNPIDNLSMDDLFHTYNLYKGDGLKSLDVYIKIIDEDIIPDYKQVEIPYDCEKIDNSTNTSYLDTCHTYEQKEIGNKKIYIESWKKINYLRKGKNQIKIIGKWKTIGENSIDWFPNLKLEKEKYELPKDMFGEVKDKWIVQFDWAWWNVSWDYNKEYTNLTGNFSYMVINKTVNDAPGFVDTRFVSCTNESLVFNHTLENTFDGQALAYNSSISPYTSGLVAGYKLDNNDFSDVTGVNNATNSGTTNTSGKILDGRSCNGGQQILVSDSPSISPTDITISVWVNFDSFSTGNRFIAAKLSSYQLWQVSGTVYIASNPFTTVSTGYPLTTGKWTHLVFTHDTSGGKRILYVDGQLVYEDTASGSIADNSNSLYFCARDATGYINADIDEPMIFNRSLSQSEVFELYNGTKGQFRVDNNGENCTLRYYGNSGATSTSSASDVYGNPVSIYYFDANANDFVGTNHGTINGATLSTGYINGSYDFSGIISKDSINLSAAILPTSTNGEFSISSWINPDTLTAQHVVVGQYVVGADGRSGFYVDQNGDVGAFIGGTGGVNYQAPTTVPTGSWSHVAWTRDSSGNFKIYLNGTQVGVTQTGVTRGIVNTSTVIGEFNGIQNNGFDGKIDEPKIYDYDLTPTQIYKLYTETAPNFIEGEEQSRTQDIAPNITLISPENNSLQNFSYVFFNITVTDDFLINNVSLYIDGILNQTNSSQHNGTYNFNISIPESNHNWSVLAYDNNSNYTQSETRYFLSDFYVPEINITYPIENEMYNFNITSLNSSVYDIHLDSCWYSLDNFSTNTSFICNTNITGLLADEGYNYWRICANDTAGKENCELVTFSVDVTLPIIEIIYPANNSYFNDTIYGLNYSAIDENGDSCWYSNDSGINNYSIQNFGNNFSISPPDGENNYFVYCNDTYGNENYSDFTFYIYNLSLTIENQIDNIIFEVGTPLNVTAFLNLGNISFDVLHPEYGINFITVPLNYSFNLIIDYFQKILFSDGNLSKEINFNYVNDSWLDEQNYSLTMHNYDEVRNVSFNISGNTSGENLIFYKINSTDIDRAFYGDLIGENIFIKKLYDNSNGTDLYLEEKNVSFENMGENLVYFYLDNNAKLVNFILNLTGFEYGFEYTNEFENDSDLDSILTNATWDPSGSLMFKGTNLQEFSFDDFEDASFNTSKFDKTPDFSSSSPNYGWSVTETGGYAREYLFWNDNDYVFEFGPYGINPNITRLNLRDAQSIYFNISSIYSSEADNEACNGYSRVYLGGTTIWTMRVRGATETVSNQREDTTSHMSFNLTKNNDSTWNVKLGGFETAFGISINCPGLGDDSAVYDYYNWTNGTFTTDWVDPTCNPLDTSGNLTNDFNVSVDYNNVEPIYIVNYIQGTGDCIDNSVDTKTYFINDTLYYRNNGSFISESIFDSSADIVSATMNVQSYSWVANNDSATYYMSADNGEHWENVVSGVEHNFVNPGRNIKWRIDLETPDPGYRESTPWIEWINISTEKSYPSNITLDFGRDGTDDYSFSGYLNDTNSPIVVNLTLADISDAFEGSSAAGQTWLIPLELHSDSAGIIQISDINLTYNPNPVYLNSTAIQNYLDSLNSSVFETLNFTIGAINGSLNLTDLKYNYRGGNATYEVLAHSDDYVINKSINITGYYSRWDYEWVPQDVEWLLFTPRRPDSKNVSAYGQTESTPIWNITNYGYGGLNSTLSLYVNRSIPCVNLTLSLNGTKDNGFYVNESWINITNMEYLETINNWLWADLDCSYSSWYLFQPQFYFRQCVDGGYCSEELE